jgi:hypothetical protein
VPPGLRAAAYDTGDSGPCVHWSDADETLYFHDAEHGLLRRWAVRERSVSIFASAPETDPFFVEEAYAAVRWMTCLGVFARSGAVMHAGAVAYGGRGALIVGDKGSGKTTLTTAALARGAGFLASDRAFVWREGSRVRVSGWICTYRVDPVAIAGAIDGATHRRLLDYVARHAAEPTFTHAGKVRIPPLDLVELLGAEPAFAADLRVIAELRRGGPDRLVVEEIPAAERAEVLRRHGVRYTLPAALAAGAPAGADPADLRGVTLIRLGGAATPAEYARGLLERLA